jgi:hypothetical protein
MRILGNGKVLACCIFTSFLVPGLGSVRLVFLASSTSTASSLEPDSDGVVLTETKEGANSGPEHCAIKHNATTND